MGAFGGPRPKRHLINTNHEPFAYSINGRGGRLSIAERQENCTGLELVKKGKNGQFTGIRDRLKASQFLGCTSVGSLFWSNFLVLFVVNLEVDRCFTAQFGAWLAVLLETFGGEHMELKGPKCEKNAPLDQTDFELFWSHCVEEDDGTFYLKGDMWWDVIWRN